MTPEEVMAATQSAGVEAQHEVPPLTQPLTFEAAIARALKYNLSQRALRVEQAVAAGVWEAGKYDLLPRLTAGGAYQWRDSYLTSRSRDSVTGRPSLANPFISSDREVVTSNLGISWSALDFSVGYYLSRQNADRALIVAEHRRRAMHALTREVALAFWRMASAQRLREEVQAAIQLAREGLEDYAAVEEAAVRAPEDALRAQRQLLENLRLLSNIERDFGVARVTLANLINVPLGSSFSVVEPDREASTAILDLPIDELERAALVRNGELREQLYKERIARDEVKKTIARLIPGLNFEYHLRNSSDSFLVHDLWQDAGAVIAQNLTALASAPAQRRLSQAAVSLEHERFIALQMALLAQLHIARLEVEVSYEQLQLATRISALDDELRRHSQNRVEANTAGKLSQVSASTEFIVSRLRRYQALADFHAASSSLQAVLGLEIEVAEIDSLDLPDLIAQLDTWQSTWTAGRFGNTVPAASPAAVP